MASSRNGRPRDIRRGAGRNGFTLSESGSSVAAPGLVGKRKTEHKANKDDVSSLDLHGMTSRMVMPEPPLTPDKRRIALDPDTIVAPERAPFVELGVASCFSFLRGASDAVDLVSTARALGYDALGIADANSMAGVVCIRTEAKTLKLKPIIGCRI